MAETWLPVVGYEGFYEVSDLGHLRSVPRDVLYSTGHWRTLPGRRLSPLVETTGYKRATLSKSGIRRKHYVHSLVLEAFVGPSPPAHEACHSDGDKLNNSIGNLRWGTSADNSTDMRKHGRLYWANRTHCPSGHEYVPDNIYLYQGRRYCRACRSGGRNPNVNRKS